MNGGSLTWYEPPPTLTVQTGGILVDHLSSRQLPEGTINASLSWQFNLTELNFIFWTLLFDKISVAVAYSLGPVFQQGFKSQFGIDWIPDQTFVRLVIFNVTSAENGAFTCQVVAKANSSRLRFKSYVQVDVVVPPMVTLASKVYVGREQAASLICEVEGNPLPIISWSPCYGQSVVCDRKYLNISKVQTASANYTCTATNAVGVDSATTLLLIGGKIVYLRLSLAGECDSKDSVWKTLQKEFGKVFSKTQGYSGAELIDVRCESLIFDVGLKFSVRVAEDDTISVIQSAVVDGKLGELCENVSYIIGIPPVKQSTTAAPTSNTPKSNGTTSAPSTTKPTSTETGGSAGPQWAVIGSVAGIIVVVVIVVVVVSWWVHKQRKCRKDIKIYNSDMELRQGVEGRYLQVQCAQSGPPVAIGTDSALWRKSDYR